MTATFDVEKKKRQKVVNDGEKDAYYGSTNQVPSALNFSLTHSNVYGGMGKAKLSLSEYYTQFNGINFFNQIPMLVVTAVSIFFAVFVAIFTRNARE